MVCPAIGSIAGMPILAPLLILLVAPGATHNPRKIAAVSHAAPIAVCAAMCALPAIRIVSLCSLHLHIHDTQAFAGVFSEQTVHVCQHLVRCTVNLQKE